jgi:hypothetical protein
MGNDMLPEHKWEIAVSAGSNYPDLTQNFPGNDINLSYENDHQGMQFYAYSYHVDELDDPVCVAQRLYSLQLLLNGALRLCWGSIDALPVHFSSFARINGGGEYSVYARVIEEDPFSRNPAIDQDLSGWNNPKSRYPSCLLNLSKADSDLRALLFLVGLVSTNSPLECVLTWSTLYKILDTVRHHSKELKLSVEEFAEKHKVNAFTAACNNMSILGVYARHGATGNNPPTKVIAELDDAIDLIVSMATKFCHAYINARHP